MNTHDPVLPFYGPALPAVARADARADLAPPARRNAPAGTSGPAARSMREPAKGLRAAVFAFIAERGAHGATDAEGQAALGLGPQTYGPRRVELVTRLGLVIDSGARRPTPSGRTAAVWVARTGADRGAP